MALEVKLCTSMKKPNQDHNRMTALPSLGVKGGQKTEVLGLLLLLQGSPGTTDEKQSEAGPWGSNFEALLLFYFAAGKRRAL